MNPGSLLNHSTTSTTKIVSTAPSANFILPSFLNSCLITPKASSSPAFFIPQPNVFLKLKRNESSVFRRSQIIYQGLLAHVLWFITYFKPKYMNCSHTHAKSNINTMLGNAKPNQLAKLITLGLSGKRLKKNNIMVRRKLTLNFLISKTVEVFNQ